MFVYLCIQMLITNGNDFSMYAYNIHTTTTMRWFCSYYTVFSFRLFELYSILLLNSTVYVW